MTSIALLAGGLVAGEVGSMADLTDERIEAVLARALHRSALWESADLPPGLHGERAIGQVLPRWVDPRGELTDALDDRLEQAWQAALPVPADPGHRRFVRVLVRTVADARIVREVESVDGLFVAPTVLHAGGRFAWRWPFRVGVIAGTRDADWLHQLTSQGHHGLVYDAELLDGGSPDAYEIAIVDAEVLDRIGNIASELVDQLRRTTCVIAVGDRNPADLMTDAADLLGPAIAVGIAEAPGAWWGRVYTELCHDVPIDVAVALASRDAVVAGPERGLDATASAHWYAAVAPGEPELAATLPNLPYWDFQSESGGASEISQRVRDARSRGAEPAVVVEADRAEAAIGSGDELVEVGAPRAAARHLITEFWRDETELRKALPPGADLLLGVKIAVPAPGEIAAERPIDEPPSDGPTETLHVVVRSDVWSVDPDPQPISLPMQEHRDRPSTWALFPFRSPGTGSVVEFDVVVLHRGKPLQAATLTATVRDVAAPGERPTLLTYSLSGPDEPTEHNTGADVWLDARGAELRSSSGAVLLLSNVQQLLDDFEAIVSRVLGVEDAPGLFDDGRAVELLVELARKGHRLRTMLADFELDEARSINLLVSTMTPILPLELVYDGVTPRRGAKLCHHGTTPPPLGQGCDETSTRRVCPYAFWGVTRTVSRTVASEIPRSGTVRESVAPAPVLYAATKIADDGAVARPIPSDLVEQAASGLFPAVTRVSSWTAWRKRVKDEHPHLLVVLGHAQREQGEVGIYIGKSSVLAVPDITSHDLHTSDAPPPIVVLMACASGQIGDSFGTLPGVLTAHGASAVVGTLSKINGPQGASAAASVLQAIHDAAASTASLGEAIAAARRALVEDGLAIGLVLVSHGEIDTRLVS